MVFIEMSQAWKIKYIPPLQKELKVLYCSVNYMFAKCLLGVIILQLLEC